MQKHLRKLIYIPLFIASVYTAHFAVDLFIPTETRAEDIERAHAYLAKENLHMPDKEFTRDGCTLWPDKFPGHDFTEACLTHDIGYWAGGTKERQLEVNLQFKEDIKETGPAGPVLAILMYTGVTYLGDNGVSRTVGSQWGYGWY